MTATSGLLLVLLSNQGYWFGGEEYTIALEWAVPNQTVDAVLEWRLTAGQVELAKDRVAVFGGDRNSTLRITPPQVRVRTTMQWRYRLVRRGDGSEMEAGQKTLQIYPRDLLLAAKRPLKGKTVVVVDQPGDLGQALEAAGIPYRRVDSTEQLKLASADIILVAPDQIADELFGQSPLLDQAAGGACVGILEQPRAAKLAGYPVGRRAIPEAFEWRTGHPLLNGFEPAELQSLVQDGKHALMIELPVDEPALEIAWWPRELPGSEPVPIDALIVTKRVGQGRLTLSQLPLGAWRSDPRNAQFLANLLSYLASRPEPTPPPSRRGVAPSPATAPVPTITIPSGGVP